MAIAFADPISTLRPRVIELFQAGLHYKAIAEQTGVKPTTVRVWLSRAKLLKPKPVSVANPKSDPGYSQILKERLGKRLVKATNKLESLAEPKSAKAIGLQVKLVKDIAEPCAIVFGWGQGQNVTNLLSIQSYTTGQIQDQTPTSAQDSDQIIDIEPSPSTPSLGSGTVPSPATPGQVPASPGPDTQK